MVVESTFQCVCRHVHAHTGFLSLISLPGVIKGNCKGFSVWMCIRIYIRLYMTMSVLAVVWPLVAGGKHGYRLFLWLIVARCWGCGPDGLGAK